MGKCFKFAVAFSPNLTLPLWSKWFSYMVYEERLRTACYPIINPTLYWHAWYGLMPGKCKEQRRKTRNAEQDWISESPFRRRRNRLTTGDFLAGTVSLPKEKNKSRVADYVIFGSPNISWRTFCQRVPGIMRYFLSTRRKLTGESARGLFSEGCEDSLAEYNFAYHQQYLNF